MIVKYNENLSTITSIGVGGKCKGIFFPETEEELVDLLKLFDGKAKYKVIGNGTNLLFSDSYHDFFAISTRKMARKMAKRKNYVILSASSSLFEAYQFCLKHNLSGFEKLATIPGNIGGSLASGASCFQTSIYDFLEKVKIFHNGEIYWKSKYNLEHGYHYSTFLKNNLENPFVILSAKFCLKEGKACSIQKEYLECSAKRKLNQPHGKSFGCVFKNKNNQSSGMLIENCGLKGKQQGDAIISEKHANFIINKGNATYQNIKFLIDTMEDNIKEKYNINLEKDVEIVE